jgi:hypothetical protein
VGVRRKDRLPVGILRLAAETCRRMEDMGDPVRNAAQIHVGQVGHDRHNPGLLQAGPVVHVAAAGQAEHFVPGGQMSGDRKANAPRRARHQDAPAGWFRRCDGGHAPP